METNYVGLDLWEDVNEENDPGDEEESSTESIANQSSSNTDYSSEQNYWILNYLFCYNIMYSWK